MAEGPMHPDLVAERLGACRVAYYWPDEGLTPEGRRATLRVFVDALVGIPAAFAEAAWSEWLDRMPRRPSPADIANRARQLLADARRRLGLDARQPAAPPPFGHDEERAQPSPEACARIDALLREAGLARPVSSAADPPPWWPRPQSDEQVAGLARARHRATFGADLEAVEPERIARLREIEGISRPDGASRDRERLARKRASP